MSGLSGNVSTVVVASRPWHVGRLRKGFLSLAMAASNRGWRLYLLSSTVALGIVASAAVSGMARGNGFSGGT